MYLISLLIEEVPYKFNLSKVEEEKIHNIERFTDELISTTPDDIRCNVHDSLEDEKIECSECKKLQEKVNKFQTHSHTNTCAKKKKTNYKK